MTFKLAAWHAQFAKDQISTWEPTLKVRQIIILEPPRYGFIPMHRQRGRTNAVQLDQVTIQRISPKSPVGTMKLWFTKN